MELDVTKKVRTAIKAKLLELGVHVDDELPDYIMILIANRRTKVQMEEDLGLFLGDNTLKFSNWLHQVLKKLEEVTTGGGAGGEKPTASSSTSAATKTSPAKKSSDVNVTSTSTSSPSISSKEKDGSEKKHLAPSTSTSSVKGKDSKEVLTTSTSNKKRKSDISKDPEENDTDESNSKSPSSKKLKISRKKVDSVHSASDHEKLAVVSSSSKRSPVRTKSRSRSRSRSPSSSNQDNFKSRTRSRSPIKFNRLESSIVVTKKSEKLPKVASVLSKKPSEPIKLRSRSPVTGPRRSPIRTAAPSRRSDRDRDRERSLSPLIKSSLGVRKRYGDSSSELPSRSTHRGSLISRIRRSRTRSRTRSGSPTSKARKSLRSLVAVVKRHVDQNAAKDEEYNPLRPEVVSSNASGDSSAVASVVHVTPRPKRATKQEERGSNKLLFRALADAQKSIVSHSMSSSKAANSMSISTDSKDREKDQGDKADIRKDKDVHGSSQAQQQKSISSTRRTQQTNLEDIRERESRRLKRADGSSKPSVKDRLGYRLGTKVDHSRDDKVSSSYRDYSDEEDDLHHEDFMPGSEDYKTIKISVPTSKAAKERNVTLEYAEDETSSKHRSSSSKPAQVSYDEPKRLSIQVNVDSDTSSSEDELELEIQPRTTEDLNLECLNDDENSSATKKVSKPKEKLSIEEKLKGRLERKPKANTHKTIDSSSEEAKVLQTTENTKTKNTRIESKSRKAESSASDTEAEVEHERERERKKERQRLEGSHKKDDEQDDADDGTGSEASDDKLTHKPHSPEEAEAEADAEVDADPDVDDDHEEIEIEEYEEIEEEEDDDEYEVVIQERNIALPDPDEYEDGKSTREALSVDMESEGAPSSSGIPGSGAVGNNINQMDMADGTAEPKSEESMYILNSPNSESVEMSDDKGVMMMSMSSSNARYPLHLRTDNSTAYDTKFVVTMEGAEEMDVMTYYQEESMETEVESYSPDMDLRHRISRSFAQNQSLQSIIKAKSVRPLTSFHQQGGAVRPGSGQGMYNNNNNNNLSSRSYLPITGGHIRPPPVQIHNQSSSSAALPGSITAGGGPACKYWPECSFKDKCIYPHPKCKFGDKCTKPECPYKHEFEEGVSMSNNGKIGGGIGSSSGSGGIENDGKVICKFFPKCHSMSCQFYHPSPCRFGVGCTDVKCKNYHPGVTVAEQRSKNKLFGSVTRSSSTYNRAMPPAAHLLRWKAPSAGSGSANRGGTNSIAAAAVDSTEGVQSAEPTSTPPVAATTSA